MVQTKILIVEDDRPLADVLAYNLRQAGYEVAVASDGQDGLIQTQLKLPDLVILDVMLPVLDGIEVCRRLRASASTRDIRIMMLTAKSEETDELVGFAVGADDYVTKPFSVKVLLERVKAMFRRRSEETADDRRRDGSGSYRGPRAAPCPGRRGSAAFDPQRVSYLGHADPAARSRFSPQRVDRCRTGCRRHRHGTHHRRTHPGHSPQTGGEGGCHRDRARGGLPVLRHGTLEEDSEA